MNNLNRQYLKKKWWSILHEEVKEVKLRHLGRVYDPGGRGGRGKALRWGTPSPWMDLVRECLINV